MPARKSSGKYQSSGKKKRSARTTTPKPKTTVSSLGDRITAESKNVVRAMAIIDMCRHAAASFYEHDDPETMYEALTMAHDALKTSVGTLQMIAQDAMKGGTP